MKPLVGLIDYSSGNIFSVKSALREINCNAIIATELEILNKIAKTDIKRETSLSWGLIEY
jgi:imidazoleglycerol phosphate synthase glutamine amidotransferase subunit HisH